MPDYYKLDAHLQPVRCSLFDPDLSDQIGTGLHAVGRSSVGRVVTVKTSFTVMPDGADEAGVPYLFRSDVFDAEPDVLAACGQGGEYRYTTFEQAMAGHQRLLQIVTDRMQEGRAA